MFFTPKQLLAAGKDNMLKSKGKILSLPVRKAVLTHC